MSKLLKLVGFESYYSFGGLLDSDSANNLSDKLSEDLSKEAKKIGFRSNLVLFNNGSVYTVVLLLILGLFTAKLTSRSQSFSK